MAWDKKMPGKRISIIIPVYNVEKYIRRCIVSVVHQTVLPYEVICVDDGSPDNSGIICDEFAEEYSFIKVIHQKNSGLSVARNTGIRAATGDFFLFLDSDDTISRDCCERLSEYIYDGIDIVLGGINGYRNDVRIYTKLHKNYQSGDTVDGDMFLLSELRNNTMFCEAVHGVYSKRFLEHNSIEFVPDLLHEDEVFMPTVLHYAKTVCITDFCFYNHLLRDDSICFQKDQTPNARSIVRVISYLEELAENIENNELRALILDHGIDLFYKVYIDADLFNHRDIRLTKEQMCRDSFSNKNKIRNTLFFTNERIFNQLETKRRFLKTKYEYKKKNKKFSW